MSNSTTQADIRRELGRLVPDLTPSEWEWLVEGHYISEVERGEASIEDLDLQLRRLPHRRAAVAQDHEPKMLDVQTPRPARPDGTANKRWRAISLLLAQEGEKDPEVHEFRADVLHGQLLGLDEVDAWIKQQAEADGPPTRYLDGVPIPPGTAMVRYDADFWPDPPIVIDEASPLRGYGNRGTRLAYAVPGERWQRLQPTASGGILERLRQLSDDLSHRYRWQKAQATLFVLTGATPVVSPLSTTFQYRGPVEAAGRIVLTVDPALTPREVAEAYRRVRKDLLETATRPISDKHLELAVFGSDRAQEETWAERMRVWNKKHPQWAYSRAANFARDVQRAEQRLLHPRLRLSLALAEDNT